LIPAEGGKRFYFLFYLDVVRYYYNADVIIKTKTASRPAKERFHRDVLYRTHRIQHPHEKGCSQIRVQSESIHHVADTARFDAGQVMRHTKTYSITVPRELRSAIKWRALEERRNVSSYLSWLIAKDIARKLLKRRSL
jgi:hypothetical protein